MHAHHTQTRGFSESSSARPGLTVVFEVVVRHSDRPVVVEVIGGPRCRRQGFSTVEQSVDDETQTVVTKEPAQPLFSMMLEVTQQTERDRDGQTKDRNMNAEDFFKASDVVVVALA